MNRRLVSLGILAGALAVYALAEKNGASWFNVGPALRGGEQPEADGFAADAAGTTPAGRAAVKLNPLEGLEANAFADIVERPLFNPGRQPRPAAPASPPAMVDEPTVEDGPPLRQGPAEGDFQLLAVAAGPQGRVAALRVAATGEVLYLRKGQPVDRWSVLDVADRSVVIGAPDDALTLSLFAGAPQETAPDLESGLPIPADAAEPPPAAAD